MRDKKVSVCDGCGHEAEEGETFIISLDPNSDWWLNLFDSPQYCETCADNGTRVVK